jgi:hypothetical protein
MPIVIEGLKDLIVADIYPLARSPKDRGKGRLRIAIPEGTIYRVQDDPTRHDWVLTQVSTHEGGTVAITLDVTAPEPYPLTLVCRWGADQAVVRGPSSEQMQVTLDGLPRQRWEGWALASPGGPERDPQKKAGGGLGLQAGGESGLLH